MSIPDDFPSPPAEWSDTASLRRCGARMVARKGGTSPRVTAATVHDGYLEWQLACTVGEGNRFVVVRKNLFGKELPL